MYIAVLEEKKKRISNTCCRKFQELLFTTIFYSEYGIITRSWKMINHNTGTHVSTKIMNIPHLPNPVTDHKRREFWIMRFISVTRIDANNQRMHLEPRRQNGTFRMESYSLNIDSSVVDSFTSCIQPGY